MMPASVTVFFLITHVLAWNKFELLSVLLSDAAEARVFLDRKDWDLLCDWPKLRMVNVHSGRIMPFKILFSQIRGNG